MIAAATAVHALALLGGLAVALAALELLAARRAWRAEGVFAWATMRGRLATAPAPVRALGDLTLGDRGFTAVRRRAVVLSYVIAGVVKLRGQGWRGVARGVPGAAVPGALTTRRQRRRRCR